MWINDERRLRCDQQRVAVGIGLRHRLGADACAGTTCLVLDNYRLRPRGAEPLSHCACDGVGRSAGWVRNDYAHCLRREGLRPAEVWKDCHAKHGCGEPKYFGRDVHLTDKTRMPKSTKENTNGASVRSVDRSIAILKAFTADKPSMSVIEL